MNKQELLIPEEIDNLVDFIESVSNQKYELVNIELGIDNMYEFSSDNLELLVFHYTGDDPDYNWLLTGIQENKFNQGGIISPEVLQVDECKYNKLYESKYHYAFKCEVYTEEVDLSYFTIYFDKKMNCCGLIIN